MKSVIFNTHDVALLITIYQCLLFATFLLTLKKGHRGSNVLLALFLLSYAAIPLDNLINFGAEFRQVAINFSVNTFYLFGSAYWLESVLLLFYVRSLIYKDFKFRKIDLLYFLPFLMYLVYETNNYYLLDYQSKLAFLNGYQLADEPTYKFLINLFRECFRVFCGVVCLVELQRYQRQIKNEFANIESVDLTWLKTLVIGFLVIRAQALFVTLGFISVIEWSVYIDYESLGIAANYSILFLISFLIIFSLSHSSMFKGIALKDDKLNVKEPIDLQQVSNIEHYMVNHKPFLNQLLTLDNLANQLNLPARTLSQIINRHFNCNFFEFINGYRIEESKKLLINPEHKKVTMLDIMDWSGFNSKATFNTLFKKISGCTPTQYRKQHQQHEAKTYIKSSTNE